MRPEILRHKVFEPILVMGPNKIKNLDIRLRVKGGGHVSQIYGESSSRLPRPARTMAAWRRVQR